MPRHTTPKKPKTAGTDTLIDILKERFAAHPERHRTVDWKAVESKLNASRLAVLQAMEDSGGEPDVALLGKPGELFFVDCATESPTERRSLCYDREAWQARKEARPKNNAVDVATSMGVELLTEEEYQTLQTLGAFDTKTSSWLKTPAAIRELDGAIFGDRRYNRVFIYHNGAQSYYAARGFRAKLKI